MKAPRLKALLMLYPFKCVCVYSSFLHIEYQNSHSCSKLRTFFAKSFVKGTFESLDIVLR